jgi:hypothetical protein
MSYIQHKGRYLSLMRQFLDTTISPYVFGKRYLELWREDADEDWRIIEQWDKRYDIELQEAFAQGRISQTEFTRAWNTLFNSQSPKKQAYINMLNEVFSAIDVDAEIPRQPWQINRAELIRIVKQAVKAIEELHIDQSDDY